MRMLDKKNVHTTAAITHYTYSLLFSGPVGFRQEARSRARAFIIFSFAFVFCRVFSLFFALRCCCWCVLLGFRVVVYYIYHKRAGPLNDSLPCALMQPIYDFVIHTKHNYVQHVCMNADTGSDTDTDMLTARPIRLTGV